MSGRSTVMMGAADTEHPTGASSGSDSGSTPAAGPAPYAGNRSVVEAVDDHRGSSAAAERAALEGRSVDAARLADAVLAGPYPATEQAHAADVLAAVLSRRGMLARSAELHRWANATAPEVAAPSAVALVGTGTPAPDGEPSNGPGNRVGLGTSAPTLRAGADVLVERGVRAAVRSGGSAAALSDLTRAVATLECCGVSVLHDDSPAALGALVALHRGEADLAASLLDRALDVELGGPALRRRHLLLRAWAAMAGGDVPAARDGLAAAQALAGQVEVRDELVAVALEAGLARRGGDTRALLALWARAREAVLRHAVDLWSLLAVGELMVVAARLGEGAWLAPHATDADELLAALGRPTLWSAPWHWCGFLAGVIAEDPPGATTHAARLREVAAAAAPGDCLAPVLADAAARWLDVLAGEVDAEAVTAAVGALRTVGMAFDGARLAKEAAVRTTDRRTLSGMLALARSVLPAPPTAPVPPRETSGPTSGTTPPEPVPSRREPNVGEPITAGQPSGSPAGNGPASSGPSGPGGPSTAASRTRTSATSAGPAMAAPSRLSDREREVAALLLEGMTYRQIGDRLFITAKTVEHHVSRMRQRLGSESRTDLFADLREDLRA